MLGAYRAKLQQFAGQVHQGFCSGLRQVQL